MARALATLALSAALLLSALPALAQQQHGHDLPRPRPAAAAQPAQRPAPAPHPLAQAREQHDEGHGDHGHDAAPKPINWWHGFLGKKEGVEPSLLWRSPEQDAPYLAAVLNFSVFAYIIYRFGKKPIQESLTRRKQGIVRDIEAAQKMRKEAEERLAQYEARLEKIDSELERIRNDFREQGEREKQRIVADAEEKRDRMLKDAQFLIEQEAKQLRVTLLRETVDAAVRAAHEVLQAKVTAEDHERLAEQFLKQLAASKGAAPTRGGKA
jgi:F-type H+-transporting ATPase subunit b